MGYQSAREDIRLILSWFSEAFSRPSFKIFSSFVVGFIQLGKEAHTSSMVQSVSRSFLFRSLSSFTRFLGKNTWAKEQLVEIALRRFFDILAIKARCVAFLIIDDTIAQKSGKKIPGCSWHKDHGQNMANVFGHQWVLSALLYKDFLLPLWARLYHGKAAKGCGRFHTKIAIAQKMVKDIKLPVSCKLYVIKDLKQRLVFRDYQMRNLQAINRHVALALLSYFALIALKIVHWLRDKTACLNLSIRLLAFRIRRYILVQHISVTMKTMRIRFRQNILDTYLEQICV